MKEEELLELFLFFDRKVVWIYNIMWIKIILFLASICIYIINKINIGSLQLVDTHNIDTCLFDNALNNDTYHLL